MSPKSSLSGEDTGVIAACTFGMAVSCLVIAGYATGALVYPLHQAYGWSRSEIMLSYTVMTVAALFATLLVGNAYDRVSPRRLVVPSQIAFGAGYIAIGLCTRSNIFGFYALHLALALAAAGALPMIFTKMISVRFTANRGLAFGVVQTGTGICGLIIPPMLALLTTHYGWRVAYIGLGFVPIAGALTLSLAFLPTVASARRASIADNRAEGGSTLSQALNDRRFWTIAIPLSFAAAISVGLIANIVPLLRDGGMGQVAAAFALSVIAGSVIVGRLVTGFLLDRFWAPYVAVSAITPAGMALMVLAQVHPGASIIYACLLAIGLATGAEVDMLWFLSARYFGTAHIGRIHGVLYICTTMGVGVGGPLFAMSYDMFGSYHWALILGGLTWIACATVLLTLGPYPDDDQPQSMSDAGRDEPTTGASSFTSGISRPSAGQPL